MYQWPRPSTATRTLRMRLPSHGEVRIEIFPSRGRAGVGADVDVRLHGDIAANRPQRHGRERPIGGHAVSGAARTVLDSDVEVLRIAAEALDAGDLNAV